MIHNYVNNIQPGLSPMRPAPAPDAKRALRSDIFAPNVRPARARNSVTQGLALAPPNTMMNNRQPTAVYGSLLGATCHLILGNGGAGPTGLFGALHAAYPKRETTALIYKQNITRFNLENVQAGDIDVSLTYEPKAETQVAQAQRAQRHRRVFHDHFILVGPKANPARVQCHEGPQAAFRRIAQAGTYLSRHDDSGTNKKEREIWTQQGLTPWNDANWYLKQTTAPRESLLAADRAGHYTLTDRGTYLSVMDQLENTQVFVQGGETLLNPCSVLVKNAANAQVHAFVDFLLSATGQKSLTDFRVQGRRAFTPAHQPDFAANDRM